jgi:hypothetical protein
MTMPNRIMSMCRLAILAAPLAAASVAIAEDIDIFGRVSPQNELPNVLIMWDSSANWGANISEKDCSYDDGSGGPKATAPDKEQGTKFGIEVRDLQRDLRARRQQRRQCATTSA